MIHSGLVPNINIEIVLSLKEYKRVSFIITSYIQSIKTRIDLIRIGSIAMKK